MKLISTFNVAVSVWTNTDSWLQLFQWNLIIVYLINQNVWNLSSIRRFVQLWTKPINTYDEDDTIPEDIYQYKFNSRKAFKKKNRKKTQENIEKEKKKRTEKKKTKKKTKKKKKKKRGEQRVTRIWSRSRSIRRDNSRDLVRKKNTVCGWQRNHPFGSRALINDSIFYSSVTI